MEWLDGLTSWATGLYGWWQSEGPGASAPEPPAPPAQVGYAPQSRALPLVIVGTLVIAAILLLRR